MKYTVDGKEIYGPMGFALLTTKLSDGILLERTLHMRWSGFRHSRRLCNRYAH